MNAIKSNSIKEKKAVEMFGAEIVEKLKGLNCDFTNRCIDACHEVIELSASIKVDDDTTLVILYLVDANQDDDMGNWDYSNYTFEVI